MASISSLGISGSGLDETLLAKLMAVESQPLTAITKKISSVNTKISAYGTLSSLLSTLRDKANALSTENKLAAFSASSSDTDIFSATASGTASGGSYAINVQQLATAHKLSSATAIAGDSTAVVNSSGSAQTLSLQVAGATSPTVISIANGSTLGDLRDAINSSSSGVKATIITGQNATTGDTESRLILTASDTGKAVTVNSTISDLNSFNTLQAAQPAKLTIDGQNITSTSNTITSAINGLSIELKTAGSATLTVARDQSAAETAINEFVTAYNALNSKARSLTAYDANNKTANTLTGDSTTRNIQSQLSSLLINIPGSSSGTYSYLADLGISVGKDGSLSVDSSKLSTAIDTDFSSVSNVLNRLGSAMYAKIGDMTSTDGLLSSKTESLNTMIDSYNDQKERLQIRLDAVEARYRAQFSSLDTLLSSMQTTSSYLTQQLAQLS